jgi:MoaA/NifB/PqqE/SkfB family radical SAM enzyme
MARGEETNSEPLSFTWRQVRDLLHHHVPGQLVIQLTDRCNGLCPQCGMRATESFSRSSLKVDDVKRIIDAAAARGFSVLSFTGGEPLLVLDTLCTLIRYADRAGIKYIRTGTNGFPFSRPEQPGFESRVARLADSLAGVPLRNLWISIDSADASLHEEMRGLPGVIEGIQKALPLFHERGIYPTANLGINRNIGGSFHGKPTLLSGNGGEGSRERFYDYYRTSFSRFFEFVIDLGFTLVNTCYPMSMANNEQSEELRPVYGAESADPVVRFSRKEKAFLFEALLDTIPGYRSRLRIFSPRSALYAMTQDCRDAGKVSYPCRGGIDFFFVDAKGADAYPCGYRGKENLGKLWNLNGNHADSKCTLCDWECFRDPSYLLGPFLEATTHPLHLAKSVFMDLPFYKLWLEDLRYYRSCDFFDGRKAPDPSRLSRFEIA